VGPNVAFWASLSLFASLARFFVTVYQNKPKFFDPDIESVSLFSTKF
jgi:hypothetical protein